MAAAALSQARYSSRKDVKNYAKCEGLHTRRSRRSYASDTAHGIRTHKKRTAGSDMGWKVADFGKATAGLYGYQQAEERTEISYSRKVSFTAIELYKREVKK